MGAKVVDGEYRLMEPADDYGSTTTTVVRKRQGSVTSMSSAITSETAGSTAAATTTAEKQLRMPPSLTLSKIRSLKHQALLAAVQANLEISTVALACVYFERLALDCRVDKSNRRVSFAACLLLASKINEPSVGLVMMHKETHPEETTPVAKLQALAKPNKRSSTMFASLLEFFTQQWSLSLKHLFAAEFGVFAALSFDLHAQPSHVAFHFRRLMKTLEWNIPSYLGETMYRQWQEALEEEDERHEQRKIRREKRRIHQQEQLLNLHIEIENESRRRKKDEEQHGSSSPKRSGLTTNASSTITPVKGDRSSTRKGLLKWVGLRRAASQEHLAHVPVGTVSDHAVRDVRKRRSVGGGLPSSPSMPTLPVVEIALPNEAPLIYMDDDSSHHPPEHDEDVNTTEDAAFLV